MGLPVSEPTQKSAVLAVVVSALGYFVDIYDLLLFSVVRIPSLRSLGVADGAEMLEVGGRVLDAQMVGMLLGGVLWGVLGDKRGRLSVLFGSILLYSLANIANGFVTTPGMYGVLRFIAGVGLAGELGAGITLVSELISPAKRGSATALVASFGICGAVVAVGVSKLVDWRTAYFIGGGLGLALLAFRVGTLESGHFQRALQAGVSRGNLLQLFATKARAVRYISLVLVGAPIWFVIGILITFSAELGKAMNMSPAPSPADAVMWAYIGLAVGDLSSGLLSQYLKSRKRSLAIFIGLTGLGMAAYFTLGRQSTTAFYAVSALLGLGSGYWAVFVTVGGEQFGTNLRATAATSTPNLVRGTVPFFGLVVRDLLTPLVGLEHAALLTGATVIVVALVALRGLEETYGKPLDYLET